MFSNRKIVVVFKPAEMLRALTVLSIETPCERLGGRGLSKIATRRLALASVSVANWVKYTRWLCRMGLATRSDLGRYSSKRAWLATVTVQFDPKRLFRVNNTVDTAAQKNSQAFATAWALRELLRESLLGECFVGEITLPKARAISINSLVRQISSILKSVGLEHEIPRRFTPIDSPATEKPRTQFRASAPPGFPPRSRQGSESSGFGSLPDDAVSEHHEEVIERGARGLPLDAEFFLDKSEITHWPCDINTLHNARRVLAHKLHPDRAGDRSARDFHRVMKGFEELCMHLETISNIPESAREPLTDLTPGSNGSPKIRRVPKSTPLHKPATTPTKREGRTPKQTAKKKPVLNSSSGEWPSVVTSPVTATTKPTSQRPRRNDDSATRFFLDKVSSDAEFFARESGICWPCEIGALHEAWRSVALRFRRTTPASTAVELFARAQRGYNDLLHTIA